MSRKPCASCRPSSSSSSWIVAEEGTANWLRKDKVVRRFFRQRPGFYITVKVPKWASHIWCARPLTTKYAPPAPSARAAYTGNEKGWDIQRVLSFPAKSTTTIRIRAPMPYRDDGGPVYPPHVHALHRDGSQVFTLPFVIPECSFATALHISRAKTTAWRLIYVLDHLPSRPLKGTLQLTSAKAIVQRFPDKSTPLLLYCASRRCNASHRMAKALVQQHGFEVVAVFKGGLEATKRLRGGGVSIKIRGFLGCPFYQAAERFSNEWIAVHGGSVDSQAVSSKRRYFLWLHKKHKSSKVPRRHTTCPAVWINGKFIGGFDQLREKLL